MIRYKLKAKVPANDAVIALCHATLSCPKK
jgi:hypothetical protein